MVLIAKFTGVVIVACGLFLLIKPATLHRIVSFWGKGNRFYLGGVIRIAIGVVFLLAASESKRPGIVLILGILFLAAGILIFVIGGERIKAFLGWWQPQPPVLIRLLSLLAVAFGAFILYAV